LVPDILLLGSWKHRRRLPEDDIRRWPTHCADGVPDFRSCSKMSARNCYYLQL
jgi:hypothetical protein